MTVKERTLSSVEARMVAGYLKRKGIELDQGYLDVYRLTPTSVSEKFGIDHAEIVKAARREENGHES